MPLPLDLLERVLNTRLVLTLKDGRTVSGVLSGYDQYMNIVLDEAGETTEAGERSLGTVVLRGNNIVAIAQPKTRSTATA